MTSPSPRSTRKKKDLKKGLAFPKSSRLLRSSDFRLLHPRKLRVQGLQIIYSAEGRGRVGISISRKIVRRAHARNRIRRLIKEAFRLEHSQLKSTDIHFIGAVGLSEMERDLNLAKMKEIFAKVIEAVKGVAVVKQESLKERETP